MATFFYDSVKSWKNLVLRLWPKMLSTNQNAGFFDHQYLWKESSSVIVFLHVVSRQGKAPYETTTFAWVLPIVPLMQLNGRILLSSTFLEMSVDILVFYTEVIIKRR